MLNILKLRYREQKFINLQRILERKCVLNKGFSEVNPFHFYDPNNLDGVVTRFVTSSFFNLVFYASLFILFPSH